MHKVIITDNQGKTIEISEIKRCEQLPKKPDPIKYIIDEESKNLILKSYNRSMRIAADKIKKTKDQDEKDKIAERIEQIQSMITDLDKPKVISGIHNSYGLDPDKYFELEFIDGNKKILAVVGKVELIEIPEQQANVVSTWE